MGAETPGTISSGTGPIPSAYHDIVIGDDAVTSGNTNMNLFDNMYVGIYAFTSNVTCLNNTFVNMIADNSVSAGPISTYAGVTPPYYPTGDGIYAGKGLDGPAQPRLQVHSNPGSTYNNKFYGFNIAVECVNYYSMKLDNNYMINETPTGIFYPPIISGNYGYKLSSWNYDAISTNDNKIYNVRNGIALWQLNLPMRSPTPYGYAIPTVQYTGNCTMNGNTIKAHPGGYTAIGTGPENVITGITIQNTLTAFGLHYQATMSGNVDIDNNLIADAYSGVFVNYSFSQAAVTSNNLIYVRPLSSTGLRYGINHTGCNEGMITNNTVTVSSGTTSGDYLRGVYSNSNTGVSVVCNTADQVGRGYEFYTSNPAMVWKLNTMVQNHKGMVLNGGLIGNQGSMGNPLSNQWLPTTIWSASNPQTYVYNGADANLNWLYVKNPLTDNPSFNEGYTTSGLVVKNYSSASINVTGGTGGTCPPALPLRTEGIPLYEEMARQNLLYMTSSMPKKWINQFMLWRQMQLDTTLVDSSAAIAQFGSMAAHSRFSYLTTIENHLAMGHLDTAADMLLYDIDTIANTDTDATTGVRMADSLATNHIVNNYRDFYGLYIKYIDSALNHEDSMAIMGLAQLCPHTEGMVVYQARGLYSYIFNDLSMFNDDSCLNTDTVYRAEWKQPGKGIITAQDIGGQGYQLYPNPNDGNITLRQMVSDTGIVRIEAYDVVGRTAYKDKLKFTSKTVNLHLGNMIPGMYLLQLTGTDDKVYRFKFMKE